MIGAMPAVAVRQQRKHIKHEEHKQRPSTLTIDALPLHGKSNFKRIITHIHTEKDHSVHSSLRKESYFANCTQARQLHWKVLRRHLTTPRTTIIFRHPQFCHPSPQTHLLQNRRSHPRLLKPMSRGRTSSSAGKLASMAISSDISPCYICRLYASFWASHYSLSDSSN